MKQKVLFLLTLAIVATVSLQAQLNVGSTSPADVSAILQATSTTKGFLPPVMTTTQINAILSPANGLTVYNATLSQLQVNVGTSLVPSWAVGAGGANVYWSQQGNTGSVTGTNYLGTTDNASIGFRTNNAERVRIDSSTGFVGIGTTTPHAPLQLANTVVTRKFVLLDNIGNASNDSAFYGFGVNNSILRYQVPTGMSHSFYSNKTLVANINAVGIATAGNLQVGTIASGATTDSILTINAATGIINKRSLSAINTNISNIYNNDGALTAARTVNIGTNNLSFVGTTGSVSVVGNTDNGYLSSIVNTSAGANNFTAFSARTGNNTGGAILFMNSNARTVDGGINTATLRNDIGDLRVMSSAGNGMFMSASTGTINLNSNTGIGMGTTAPSQLLQVNGNIKSGLDNTGSALIVPGNASNAGYFSVFKPNGTTRMGYIGWDPTNLTYWAENGAMHWFQGGNVIVSNSVGIGTSTPATKLQVISNDNVVGTNILDVRAANQISGIGIGWGGIRSTSTNTNDILTIDGKGSGNIALNANGGSGNVGVGTSSPVYKLDVIAPASTAAIRVGDGGSGGGVIFGNGNHGIQRGYPTLGAGNDIGLFTTSANIFLSANGAGNVNQFILTNGGAVGINMGGVGPSRTLHVNGSIKAGLDNNGSIAINGNSSSRTGYTEFFKGTTRMGYIGDDPTNLYYRAESGAQHWFSGGNIIVENNVGIATGTPSQRLQVVGNIKAGADNTGSVILNQGYANNAGYLRFLNGNNTSLGYIGYDNNNILYQGENGAAHVFNGNTYLNNNTYIGGNTTIRGGYSNTALSIYSNDNGPKITLYDGSEGSTTDHFGFGTSGGQLNYDVWNGCSHFFWIGGKNGSGNPVLRLSSGNSQLWGNFYYTGSLVQNSDRRLKRNIVSLNSALGQVMQLLPYSYEKKNTIESNDYSMKEMGFIAQDVRKILPQLVFEGTDSNKTLSINYIGIIPLLTKAIQEQQAQNDMQVAQIASLKQANIVMAQQNAAIIEQNLAISAHNTILDIQNKVISGQLSEMKELKLAMAQLRSELNKTTATQAVLPILVTVNN